MQIKKILGLAFSLLAFSSCGSLLKGAEKAPHSKNKIYDISIGDSEANVLKMLGTPSSKSMITYQKYQFQVFEYDSADGTPLGHVTINRERKVAGYATWISRNQSESHLDYLTKHFFPNAKLTLSLVTCDLHHHGDVKVDRERGIFVGIDQGHVFYASRSNHKLTELQIKQFSVTCPDRQRHI